MKMPGCLNRGAMWNLFFLAVEYKTFYHLWMIGFCHPWLEAYFSIHRPVDDVKLIDSCH
jgi:hypothetical protein